MVRILLFILHNEQILAENPNSYCILLVELPPAVPAGMAYIASCPRLMLADEVTPEQMSNKLGTRFAKTTWWYGSAVCSFASLLLFQK